MTVGHATRVGFIGLGIMGTPMALNLARHFPITVWNRSASKYGALRDAGATVGETPSMVVKQSDVIFTMLYDGPTTQSILDEEFRQHLRGKTLINASSVTAEVSQDIARTVDEAGGDFIEMPVSGSRVPAEQGRLVSMLAGDPTVADRIKPILRPITEAAVYCGPIGSGLKTKYAVNHFLISMTAGLAESMNLARAQGLDLQAFGQVLNAGPMSSPYSKLKIEKMLNEDWTAQAAIKDCYNSTQLISSAAKSADTWSPLAQLCESLYGQAKEAGLGDEDMIALTKLFSRPAST